MSDQDKERAEFEAAYNPKWRNGKPKRMADGGYNSQAFQSAWEGWQASAARFTRLEEEKNRAERAILRAGYTYLDGAQEWRPPLGPNQSPLLDRIAELEAEVARLKADSDRLSWLSRVVDYDDLSFSLHQDCPHDGQVQICYGDKLDGDYAFGKDFRSAIDEAMKGGEL